MNFRYLTFMLVCMFSIHTYAQDLVKISGKTVNSDNQPIEFTSVIIENDVDGYVGEAISDKDGNFSFETSTGNLFIVFEAMGYTALEKNISIDKNTDIGTIILNTDQVITLQGATVVAQKPIYKVELDKKVYDMASDPMSQGLSLSDALQNVPSVQVDAEGNVALRGNDNVKFLIDGKPSGMLGVSDIGEALKNIPAETVERIEVVTNPSSRYEASGSAGIINIVLKKGANTGFNGSVTVNGGIPEMAGVNVNLNYKTKKYNLFSNIGTRYSKREGEGYGSIINLENGIASSYQDVQRESDRIRRNYNIRLGGEYYLDDKNTIGLSVGYRYNNGNNTGLVEYFDYDANRTFLGRSYNDMDEKEIEHNVDIDFNYKHEFDKKGHELSFTARYSTQKEDEDGMLYRYQKGDVLNRTEITLGREDQKSAIFTLDYVRPIGEKGKFEAGARADFNKNKTIGQNTFLFEDGTTQVNTDFLANVDNQQNIIAAYTQYGNAIGNFQYFVGLRMEHSDMDIKYHSSDQRIKKSYTDFFPSATLNYTFNDKNEVQLSYSRRIRRPMGFMLMPFFTSTDDRNIRYGNPDLNPTYTNSIELSYITTIGKLMVTPSLYYQRTSNLMNQFQTYNYRYLGDENQLIDRTNPNDESWRDDFQRYFITTPYNIGKESRYGLDLTATYRPFRWWNLMVNVNLFGYDRSGFRSETIDNYVNIDTYQPTLNNLERSTQTMDFSGDGFSSRGRLSSNFTLPKDFKTQIAANYEGQMKTAQQTIADNLTFDFSLSKDLFKNRATVTFNIRDIFDERRRKDTQFRDTYINTQSMRWMVRSFNLSFTYRFKSTNERDRKQRPEGEEFEGGGEMMQ